METLTVRPARMVAGGDALARLDDGRVVFVTGALPGELVTVSVRAVKKDFLRAEVVDVLEPSPSRISARCDAFRRGCGGCDWMHIDPVLQLDLKVDIVREALTRTARLTSPHVVAAGAVSPWGYRATVRLATTADGRPGFRSRRSHDVIPVTHCPVATPAVNDAIAELPRVRTRDDIVIRADGKGSTTSVTPLAPGVIHEHIAGRKLRVSPSSFFQSSPEAAELLVESVARLTASVDVPNATVLDAYGGVGLFAATIGAAAKRVIVVEASKSSCADARANLAGRDAEVENCRVEDWTAVACDLAIADPARSGLDRAAAERLAATAAPHIVLVSCDAGSLGRDARLLVALGYEHRVTEVLDLFPNTSHVEAVTHLVRAG